MKKLLVIVLFTFMQTHGFEVFNYMKSTNDVEKAINETTNLGVIYKYNGTIRSLKKYLYNRLIAYCNYKQNPQCDVPILTDLKYYDHFLRQFKNEFGVDFNIITSPTVLDAFTVQIDRVVYLNAVEAYFFDPKYYKNISFYFAKNLPADDFEKTGNHDKDFAKNLLQDILKKIVNLDQINQNALIKNTSLFKLLLDETAQIGGDNSDVKNFLKDKNLTIFETYLTEQEQAATEKHNQAMHALAQGLNDIK